MINDADHDEVSVYEVRYTSRVYREIDDALLFIAQHADNNIALDWLHGLDDMISTLAIFPNRYPHLSQTGKSNSANLRQLVYRRTAASQGWNVIYRVFEATERDVAHVYLLSVRHGARKPISRKEAREIEGAA